MSSCCSMITNCCTNFTNSFHSCSTTNNCCTNFMFLLFHHKLLHKLHQLFSCVQHSWLSWVLVLFHHHHKLCWLCSFPVASQLKPTPVLPFIPFVAWMGVFLKNSTSLLHLLLPQHFRRQEMLLVKHCSGVKMSFVCCSSWVGNVDCHPIQKPQVSNIHNNQKLFFLSSLLLLGWGCSWRRCCRDNNKTTTTTSTQHNSTATFLSHATHSAFTVVSTCLAHVKSTHVWVQFLWYKTSSRNYAHMIWTTISVARRTNPTTKKTHRWCMFNVSPFKKHEHITPLFMSFRFAPSERETTPWKG